MKRIFIDHEKCEGCKNCSIACMQAHRESPGTVYDLDLLDGKNEARHRITNNRKGGYVPVFCRHCAVPDCVGACMSGALKKESSGLVLYDEKRCAACFMCVMSCPFGNIKPDAATKAKIIKCDFCKGDNETPNCTKSCPNKTIHVKEINAGGIAV